MSAPNDRYVFASAMVIDARVDNRTAIREAIKAIGVQSVVSCSSVDEALTVLQEGDIPEWIVMDVEADQSVNAFDLMKIRLDDQAFANTYISLTITESDHGFVPLAFELGALSFHKKPFTTASLKTQFDTLLTKLSRGQDSSVFVAAEYLRDYLVDQERYDELVSMEEALIRQFPDSSEVFLKLAEAQFIKGDEEAAKKTLWQARFLGQKIELGVKQMEEMVHGEESVDLNNSDFANTFGLSKAIVVDPDDSSATQVEEVLRSIGVGEVLVFDSGQTAADWLAQAKDSPDLIVTEWRMPGISSVALIQRVREKGFHSVPIVVTSSLVGRVDKPLLSEMTVADTVEKPVVQDAFSQTIMRVIRQEKFPTDTQAVVRKFHQSVAAAKVSDAASWIAKYVEISQGDGDGTVETMRAELAFLEQNYELAQKHATNAMRQSKSENTMVLNILGKTLLKVGDHEGAIKCLNKAQEVSCDNLERLCLLAEAHSEKGDAESADASIRQARSVDEGSQQVDASEAKVALNAGDSGRVKKALTSLGSLGGLVSYSNTRAIGLVRDGQVDDGIELYQTALSSLSDKDVRERNSVLYNLGLAHVRANNLRQAIATLKKVDLRQNKDLGVKVESLIKRSHKALREGQPVKLSAIKTGKLEDSSSRPVSIYLKVGEACLHHIYHMHEDNLCKEHERLLGNRVRFKRVSKAG